MREYFLTGSEPKTLGQNNSVEFLSAEREAKPLVKVRRAEDIVSRTPLSSAVRPFRGNPEEAVT